MKHQEVRTIKLKVNISDLHRYMAHIKDGKNIISLNEFIKSTSKYKDNDQVQVISDLTNITFDQDNAIDLSGANLSGTKLDKIDFDGKYVKLKGADLRGASIKSCKFTNNIDLNGVKLGTLILNSDVFIRCKLSGAEYEPGVPKVAMISVTDKQLENYHKLRNQGVKIASGSLNDYLASILRHNYPEDITIIADLSGREIDSSFSGANLTGSNLEGCNITGKIENLILRDCHLNQTSFTEVELINPDLRGCCLSSLDGIGQEFVAANFVGRVVFTNPKLSIDSNIALDQRKGILPQTVENLENEDSDFIRKGSFNIEGAPIYDPCYLPGSSDALASHITVYREFAAEDVREFADHCNQLKDENTPTDQLPSFRQFMKDKHQIDQDFIPDLSGLDLRNLDLSDLNFERCNFAHALLSGSTLDRGNFKNCNFSGADLSKKAGGWWYKAATLISAIMDGSDFTCAELTGVNAEHASLNDVRAINLSADNFNIEHARANGANFCGSWLYGLKAKSLEAIGINLSHVFGKKGNYDRATLTSANMAYGDFSLSSFDQTEMDYANLLGANLRKSKLKQTSLEHARLAADISGANLFNLALEGADLAGLFHQEESNEPTIEKVDFSKAIESQKQHELSVMQDQQQMQRNEKRIYDKYAIAMVIGALALSFSAAAPIYLFAPKVVTAAAIIMMTQILAPIIATFTAAVGVDRAINHFSGVDLGLTRNCADLFGAKKIVASINAPLEKQIAVEHTKLEQYRKGDMELGRNEQAIEKASHQAQQPNLGKVAEQHASSSHHQQKIGNFTSPRHQRGKRKDNEAPSRSPQLGA